MNIGSNTWVGIDCKFFSSKPGSITIGKNCDIAPNILFVNGTHEIGNSNKRAGEEKAMDIIIGDGTWIGSSVTINGGAIVGKGTVVASGSVVMNEHFPNDVIIAGVPAKVIKKLKP